MPSMPSMSKMLEMNMTGGYNAYKKSRKRKSRGRGIKSRTRKRSMKRLRSVKRK